MEKGPKKSTISDIRLAPGSPETPLEAGKDLLARLRHTARHLTGRRRPPKTTRPPYFSPQTRSLRGDHGSTYLVPAEGRTGREHILEIPEGLSLAINDGEVLYAVSSRSRKTARNIMEEGFRFAPRGSDSSYKAILSMTAVPLDGPGRHQTANNVDFLAYRYAAGFDELPDGRYHLPKSEAKVVLGFPTPNNTRPGAFHYNSHQTAFDGTPLSSYDGHFIQFDSATMRFIISPRYIAGYFEMHDDQAEPVFVHNPRYWANQPNETGKIPDNAPIITRRFR